MYVISLVTESDVVKGNTYKVTPNGSISVLDEKGGVFEMTPDEYLVADESCYKEAYLAYHNKTEWVQETSTGKELGRHRADILRERIEALQEENAELKFRLASLEK